MCVRVATSNHVDQPWNQEQLTISIPAGLTPGSALNAVRAVLIRLDIAQPADGAVCYCGELVTMPVAPVIPAQRQSEVSRVAS